MIPNLSNAQNFAPQGMVMHHFFDIMSPADLERCRLCIPDLDQYNPFLPSPPPLALIVLDENEGHSGTGALTYVYEDHTNRKDGDLVATYHCQHGEVEAYADAARGGGGKKARPQGIMEWTWAWTTDRLPLHVLPVYDLWLTGLDGDALSSIGA